MNELIELQHQANQLHNLLHEQMIRSAPGVDQCVACGDYYSRIVGHKCAKGANTAARVPVIGRDWPETEE